MTGGGSTGVWDLSIDDWLRVCKGMMEYRLEASRGDVAVVSEDPGLHRR